MSQKKLSAVIYGVLLALCLLALGYLWGFNQASTDVTVTIMPSENERRAAVVRSQIPVEQGALTNVIDLNTADQQALETLPGIGPALAERILAYRDEIGAFSAKEQLLNVEGIGQKRFEDIAPWITIGGTP
ncbi:MAG: helix-hairpin-helix domain-containing protein [Oscillospiraceae bacterium]|nr:helix-hairpin-helix domain-containing protein [Oscillospiraceae bacterium]